MTKNKCKKCVMNEFCKAYDPDDPTLSDCADFRLRDKANNLDWFEFISKYLGEMRK